MTYNEVITTLASILALIISLVSLMRTSKLAKLQIQNLEEENSTKTKPKFNVTLTKLGNSRFFYIVNTGQGSAYDVNFTLIDCQDSPLLTNEINQIFPHAEMKPNARVKLNAATHMGSPIKYQVELSWKDKLGKSFSEIFWVTRS